MFDAGIRAVAECLARAKSEGTQDQARISLQVLLLKLSSIACIY